MKDKGYKSKWTCHHLAPTSVGGTGCEENKIMLKQEEHRGHHSKFSNKLFHDQIIQILDENYKTLLPEAIEIFEKLKIDIKKCLKEEKFYKRKCFKYGNYPKV